MSNKRSVNSSAFLVNAFLAILNLLLFFFNLFNTLYFQAGVSIVVVIVCGSCAIYLYFFDRSDGETTKQKEQL